VALALNGVIRPQWRIARMEGIERIKGALLKHDLAWPRASPQTAVGVVTGVASNWAGAHFGARRQLRDNIIKVVMAHISARQARRVISSIWRLMTGILII